MSLFVISGTRSNGETLVLNKQDAFSFMTRAARTFPSEELAKRYLKHIKDDWLGLALEVEDVGDGSGIADLISYNPLIGENGY